MFVSCSLVPLVIMLVALYIQSVPVFSVSCGIQSFSPSFFYLLSPQSCPSICPTQYHDKIFNRYTSSPMSMQKLQYCISKLQLQGEVIRFSCVPRCVHSALIPQSVSLSDLCHVLLQYERSLCKCVLPLCSY